MRMERGERSTCTLSASTQVIKSEWQQGSDAQNQYVVIWYYQYSTEYKFLHSREVERVMLS